MQGFTPVEALVGGGLMGLGLAVLLVASGRLAGPSAVVAGILWPGDRQWRVLWVVSGLVAAAAFFAARPSMFDPAETRSLPLIALSGMLVGFGTRVGGGCTAGHGFCGSSRGSKRSIVAMMTFTMVGMATATLVGTIGGRS